MPSVQRCQLPAGALLARYGPDGAYVDCYVTEVAGTVSHAQYVEAFYTTPLFGLERLLLSWFASRPSTNGQAQQLAAGTLDAFAAWFVEDRSVNQLLLCDFTKRTRSWLMVAPAGDGGSAATRLYFGSAVVPVTSAKTGESTLGAPFHALLGFHKLYSRALLHAARSRLASSTAKP